MTSRPAARLGRALLVLSALAALWAAVVAASGGLAVSVHSIRLSSRSPQNAGLMALLSGIAGWALLTPVERRSARERLAGWLGPISPSILIALVGVGLEVVRWSGARPLWLDEEMIALNLRERPLAGLAGPLWLAQSAPFGWLAVQRLIVVALGSGERALRLVPLLFGIGTLAAAIWIGRRWMSPVGAAVLVLLCAFGQWISFYGVELKHYSADTFWALLLPALAAWASEHKTRALVFWWAAAALGHWFANGALLVTPACALVLLAWSWRRHGWRRACAFGLIGLLWLVSFGLHYKLVLRHALGSEYLQRYWSFAIPPASIGLNGTLSWIAGQLEPLALKPGGTGLWGTFWLAAAGGFALTSRRPKGQMLGILFATVPLSAFLFAGLGVVPLFERVSLWLIPALYAGVALFADNAVWLARDGYARRSVTHLALAAVVSYVGFRLCSDILVRGVGELQLGRSAQSNHRLDDRAGVQWLMQQRQPGDAMMTTRLALPALWWYGHIPISDSAAGGSRLPDGSPIFEAGYRPSGPDCEATPLAKALQGQRRVLVYLGFRFDDVPSGFDDILLRRLSEVGVIRMLRQFSDAGRAAVIELRTPSPAQPVFPVLQAHPAAREVTRSAGLDGCIVVQPARRW